MSIQLVQIIAPYMTAGIVAENGLITETAPVLVWSRGKSLQSVLSWAAKKGFNVTLLEEPG